MSLTATLAPAAAVLQLEDARAACAPSLASSLAQTGRARQLITVIASDTSSTNGTLELWTRVGACWQHTAGPWQAWLGWAGVSAHHLEGDGTTPEGAYGIGRVMYGVDPDPDVHYAYHELVCGDWWDEDPSSPAYNRFVHVPCGTAPDFGGDSEALWQSPGAYAYFALVDYNTGPVVPGAGSAIFLHVSTGGPTDGCVSLPERDLLRTLRWLRPGASPLIAIGTTTAIFGT